LISPLNWGLGHASRIIPIIDYCLKSGKHVVIAGNGSSLELLKMKFPQLKYEHIPSPAMQYGIKSALNFNFYIHAILMFINILRERIFTKRIIRKHKIDTIISDNRPGVFNRKIKSIYITHQINIYRSLKEDKFSQIMSRINYRIIKQYNYCWSPDFEAHTTLAGRLSKNNTNSLVNYIGPLSRFSLAQSNGKFLKKYEVVCIVSGPEPPRKFFEQLLVSKFSNSTFKTLIIRGLPNEERQMRAIGNVEFLNHCTDEEFLYLINSASHIICRSGYSSVMDMIVTCKNAILIPTPGQPEQEYLAIHLNGKYGFTCMSQNDFASANIEEITNCRSEALFYDKEALKKVLDLHL
jgi:uncharacterized protein (TIGR00661 family)